MAEKEKPFGPEYSLQYKDGDDELDVTFAAPNMEKIGEAWSGGVKGMMERGEENIRTTIGKIAPSGINAGDDEEQVEVESDVASAKEVYSYKLKWYEEHLDVNPKTKGETSRYMLKVHLRTVSLEERDGVFDIKAWGTGHQYYELIDLKEDKSQFFSLYPDGNQISSKACDLDKAAEKDKKCHKETNKLMVRNGEQYLFTKTIYLEKSQYEYALEFAANTGKDKFVILANDCTDFGEKLFENLEMKIAYPHLFKASELKNAPVGYKINYRYGSRAEAITVSGDSEESVAREHGIGLQRVVKKYNFTEDDLKLSLKSSTMHLLYMKKLKDKQYLILPPKQNRTEK